MLWRINVSSTSVGDVNRRLQRVTVVVVVAAGTAAVTLMVGLVTNAASEQGEWPGVLAYVQRYPWQSLAGLAVVAIGLAAGLAVLSAPGSITPAVDRDPSSVDHAVSPTLTPVLRALPPDLTDFANRQDEIDQVVRRLDGAPDGGGSLVHTVDGMPGVGKTSLAIHIGHALAPHFPDGQVFLNLNGFSPDRLPVAPAEALASLLLADGVPPQKLPAGDDEWSVSQARAAMWRSRIANRRMLVILDNAATFEQVEHLLPGTAGCLVLVTSRRRLVASEAAALQVQALDTDDAAALFVRLSRRTDLDPASVEELVQMGGRLPLAVSLLAARLRHHPAWSADDLKERLLKTGDRLAEMRLGGRAVAAAFDISYHDLPPQRQVFFLRLSRFPGHSVNEGAAAALGDMTPEEARRHLDALYDDHLLDESEPGRYRFHDLVRDYARGMSRAGLSADDGALARLAEYYLHAVGVANGFIGRTSQPEAAARSPTMGLPTIDSRAAALAWMDSEHVNVLLCVEECRREEEHGLVVRLASAMAPYLRHAGPWDRAAYVHRLAVEAARADGDRSAEADALSNLGLVLRLLADYPAAAQALSESLDAFGEVGNERGQQHALNQLGIVWYLTADYPQATRAQAEALAICRRIGDLLGQANALADLGMVHRMTGHLSASTEAQAEALATYRQIGDRFGEANSLRALGVVSRLSGDYRAAEHQANEALVIYREVGDRIHQAYALNELGAARRHLGNVTEAERAHQDALHLARDLGDRFSEAEAMRNIGILHRLGGDLDSARQAQAQSTGIYADIGNRGGEAATSTELGVLAQLDRDRAAATAAFDQALAIFRDLGDRCSQAEVLNHRGALHLAGGEPSLARKQFDLALRLSQEINLPIEEAHAWRGLGQCLISLGSPTAAAERLTRALSIYERLGVEERLAVASQLRTLTDNDNANDPIDASE